MTPWCLGSISAQYHRHMVRIASRRRHFFARDLVGRSDHLNAEPIIVAHTLGPSRDLLFGLLALQTGLINQAQLVAAFHAWTQARDRPMSEILAEQGALQTACRTLIEGLV